MTVVSTNWWSWKFHIVMFHSSIPINLFTNGAKTLTFLNRILTSYTRPGKDSRWGYYLPSKTFHRNLWSLPDPPPLFPGCEKIWHPWLIVGKCLFFNIATETEAGTPVSISRCPRQASPLQPPHTSVEVLTMYLNNAFPFWYLVIFIPLQALLDLGWLQSLRMAIPCPLLFPSTCAHLSSSTADTLNWSLLSFSRSPPWPCP